MEPPVGAEKQSRKTQNRLKNAIPCGFMAAPRTLFPLVKLNGRGRGVNAPETTECRNGHGAHQTGTARTKRARRARNGHGAHEMARHHLLATRRCCGADEARTRTTGGGGMSGRAPSAADRRCLQTGRITPRIVVRPRGGGRVPQGRGRLRRSRKRSRGRLRRSRGRRTQRSPPSLPEPRARDPSPRRWSRWP